MNGRKTETDNAENKFQKKRPDVLKRVRIQYILVFLMFIIFVGLGIFYIINLNQVATDTAISSYQQTELEVVREAARGVQEYVYVQTVVLGRKDIPAIEQEIYTKLIDPIRLLKNGDAWIYAPDHIVFDQSADLPEEYWGKSMAQIFALQQKSGASHYEEMTADVSNAREGVGYYVWLPEKGPEIAAWTPVRVGNNTWTIGLSTPLPEILEASGASSQIAMATAVILFSIILALILLSLWLYSDLKRRQVHEELRESEEKYRTVFENTGTAMVVVEESNIISLANAEFAKLSGFSKDDIEGKKSWTEFVVKGDLDRMLAQHRLRRQNREKALTHYEFRFVTKSGDIRTVYLSIDVIPGTKKSAASLLDITRRKRAEETLRVVQEKYTKAFHSAPDAITISELDSGRFVEVNEAATTIFGYSREELIGKSALELGIWPKKEDRAAFIDQIKQHGRIIQYEVIEQRKSGELFNALVNADIMSIGMQNFLIAIIRDITKQKQVEGALKKSQIQLSEAMDLAHLANWEFDVPTGIFTFNDRFYALYGTTAEREGGYQMPAEVYAREFVHPDEINVVADEVNKAIQATDPDYVSELEHRIVRRNGEIRHIIVRFGITKDENGRTIKTHGANQDITNRKLAEEWLKKFSEELESKVTERTEALNNSLHEKDILFKEVHHRVKNNMQIIISLLNLQSRTIDDPVVLKVIKESQNRIRAMALVHERLYRSGDISRIDLKDYIQFLARELFSFYGVKPQLIRFTINAPAIMVNIDTAIPLGLMINELISNAIKYAFPGDRKGEIVIDIKKDKNDIFLIVRDNGVGIPQDFDWRNAKSLGLRLVISLVEQLQGTIELDQTTGTTFTIVIKEKQ